MKSLSAYILESENFANFYFVHNQLHITPDIFDEMNAKNYLKSYSIKLSDSEKEAIDAYRDTEYVMLNRIARGQEKGTKDQLTKIKLISSAIKKSKASHDLIVFRGLSDKKVASKYAKAKIGSIISDSGFTSTSLSKPVMKKFIDNSNTIGLKIYVSKGKSILPMQNFGSVSTQQMYNDEFEMLIDRSAKSEEFITLIYK